MNILTPRFTPGYSRDSVKSRSDIRHCIRMAMTALAIMFQTQYSKEHKHYYTTKNIFSVSVSLAYWEFHCLSIFCRNFGSCFTLLPAAFDVLHQTLIVFCQKNSRQTSFGAFSHHSNESFYLSVPFLLSHSCFLTSHVFVRSCSILMHFGHKDLGFCSKYNGTGHLVRKILRGKKSVKFNWYPLLL
jgi:hypothetical protein